MTNQTKSFDVPVGIFFFNRPDLLHKVLEKLQEIKPVKLYLLGDGPREGNQVDTDSSIACHQVIDELVTWDCQVHKRYSEKNLGVFNNIAGGAKWVFQQEKMAIFIEDDNFPETTFFTYCQDLLIKYESEERILWICGNNFLIDYDTPNNESYIFTQHLHPCGWASWSAKFLKYYDSEMAAWSDKNRRQKILKKIKYIPNKSRFHNAFTEERNHFLKGERFVSWDFHMYLSILNNNLIGIVPKNNLIRNIGVDERATHGSASLNEGVAKYVPQLLKPLIFPLVHPEKVEVNHLFDDQLYLFLRNKGIINYYLYYFLIIKVPYFGIGNNLFNLVVKLRSYLPSRVKK